MSFLAGLAVDLINEIGLDDEINRALINRLVTAGRSRPHPWSTQSPRIDWSTLTDRTYNARLLPPDPYPDAEMRGTRRPPTSDVAALFKAQGAQRRCPKSTCLFPTFAQYLTDGFIRTQIANTHFPGPEPRKEDRARTTSNHEIDLSPLYGRNKAQTAVLRAFRGGRLKTQTINGEEFPPYLFIEDSTVDPQFCDANGVPVLDMPLGLKPGQPGIRTMYAVGGDRANATAFVAAMNLLFLREHNRLAGLLEQKYRWDDERLFQTARNILIVMFIKLVVEEYINHINTSVFRFQADPSGAWKADWNRPNWMTAEFSLLYRWHSLVPESFDWNGATQPGWSFLLNNAPLEAIGLAQTLIQLSANQATELGLHNSASFLVDPEIKAVEQARSNQLTGYNAYRRAMGLDAARNFEDVVGRSEDPVERSRREALATELAELYDEVDNLEFYVGLFAEPRSDNGPLPELLTAMVAMDAFSQALTNPLLSEHIWGDKDNREAAFTKEGLAEIRATRTLRDVLVRNARGTGDSFVGMTRRQWRRT